MKFRRVIAASALAILIVGCTATNRPFTPLSASGTAPAAQAISTTIDGHRRKGKLRIRVRIPRSSRHHRAPRYISAATKGMTMAFTGPTTMTQVVNLTPSDPRCTGIPLTCTIAVTLLAGGYTVTIDTYDKAPVGGSIPAGAKLLSTAKNAGFTMTGGITNSVGIALDGIPASFAVGALPSGTIGTPTAATPFAVTVKDADGDIITGTYDNAVALANGDHSGATTVATSGSDAPPAGKLLSSSDVSTLAYTGGSIDSATITASATGATSGNATFAPLPALASIGTGSGLIGTSTSETLTGNFVAGATTVNVSGTGVTVRNVVATNTTITASFFVDPEAATGGRNVTVQTNAGKTSASSQTFTIGSTGVDVVTLATDSALGTTPGTCTSAGNPGDLRHTLCAASASDTIVFDTTVMCGGTLPCTITLGAALPPIVQNQTIDGGYFGRVTIDGGGAYRPFFVDTGTVILANLQIQNAAALGGAGGDSGGGGGLGAGGAVFVNKAGAAVTIDSVYFLTCSAVGGTGAVGAVGSGSGGGGGLSCGGGAGGGATGSSGGGGVLAFGSASNVNTGGNGGNGGGGAGSGLVAGTGGAGFATNTGGANGTTGEGAAGGSGGFGGGGGGGIADDTGGAGGAGGFGGGGGGGGAGVSIGAVGGMGGAGGPGGGGGGGGDSEAGTNGSGGIGGLLLSPTLHGGAGGDATGNNGGAGGGGAAAGPAIFVNAGTLTTTDSGASGSSATGGNAGVGGGSPAAGTANATPVFNYGGTVNGSGTTGPVSAALSGSPPSARRPHAPANSRRSQPKSSA
jgi:hypothetical protein